MRRKAAPSDDSSRESLVFRRWLTPAVDATSQRARDGVLLGLNYVLAAGYMAAVAPDLGQHKGFQLVLAAAFGLAGALAMAVPWRRLPASSATWFTAGGFAAFTLTEGALGELASVGVPYSLGFAFAGMVLGAVRSRQILAISLLCLAIVVVSGGQRDHLAEVIGTLLAGGIMGELVAASTAGRRRQTRDLQRLQEGMAALLGVRDEEHAASQITALAAGLLHADGVGVAMKEADGTLVVRGMHSSGEDLTRLRIADLATAHPGLNQVAATGIRLFVADAPNDPRVHRETTQTYRMASLLMLPLMGQDGVIGVVSIWWEKPRAELDAFGEQVGQLLSLQAGSAMERAVQVGELDRAALTDPLTGIGNRRAFEHALAGLPEDAALVLCDLDRFKELNDTQGHPAGDRVLRAFAAVAASCVRGGSDLVARIGGDEFAIVVGGGQSAGEAVVERLRAGWNDPEGVGFSAGLVARMINEDAYQLSERADQALYAQKRLRRRRPTP